MNIGWKTALTLTLLWGVNVTAVRAQDNKPAQAGPVKDVLPKAVASPQIEALRKQLSSVIVFRDSITGEFRAADPGEHAALTGSRPGVARVAAPAAGRLPDGGLYLPVDPAKVHFLTVVKNADGAVSYNSANTGDKKDIEKPQGGRDEK